MKLVMPTSPTCLFVPFGPLFEKTIEFFDFGVILRCLLCFLVYNGDLAGGIYENQFRAITFDWSDLRT